MTSLVHPRLTDRLSGVGYFPTRITIQANTPTRHGTGAPVDAWAAVPGFTGIPARVAPVTADERRTLSLTFGEVTHTALVPGAYPDVTRVERVVDDAGTAYDITGVEVDSQGTTTRIGLRVAGV